MSGTEPSVLSDSEVGVRVVRGGAQRAVGFMIANLLTAASAVILLRYLGVDQFGRYGIVLAVVGVVYGISDMGLNVTGTRELALCETPAETRDLLAHLLGLRITVTGLGVLIGVGFAALAGYGHVIVLGVALAGIGTFMQSIQAAMLIPLSIDLRNGLLAFNQVLTQGVLLFGFAVLAVAGAGLAPFFAVQILVGAALLAAAPLLLSRWQLVAPRWTPARLRALGVVALPIAVGTVLGVLYLRILVILMSLLIARPAQLGYFVTSTRVLELVGGLPFLVISVVLPVVTVAARDDRRRLVYMTSRISQSMALAGVLTALILWTLARPIVTIVGGSQYGPAASVLAIQGFATITIFLNAAWQPALLGMNRLRSFALAMTLGVAAVIISGVVLIPPFAATGAAVAAVIGDVTLCAAMYVAVRLSGPGPWLDVGGLVRVAMAAGLAVAVGLIPGLGPVVRTVLVAGAFVAVALMLHAIPSEIMSGISAAAARWRGRSGGDEAGSTP